MFESADSAIVNISILPAYIYIYIFAMRERLNLDSAMNCFYISKYILYCFLLST